MASKITYTNKVARNVSTEDDQYKVTANDMNEIKEAVNNNADELGGLNNRNAISLRLNGDYTISSSDYEVIPFSRLAISPKVGNNFSISENGIQIGEGIKSVLVYATIYWYTDLTNLPGLKIIELLKNGNSLMVNNRYLSNNYQHQQIQALINVEEGDIITLKVKGRGGELIKDYFNGTNLIAISIA